MTTDIACPECGAPLRMYEWQQHWAACTLIAASDGKDVAGGSLADALAPYGVATPETPVPHGPPQPPTPPNRWWPPRKGPPPGGWE